MSYESRMEKNPFFKHNINQLCIICNRQLKSHRNYHSIFEELSGTQLQMKVCEALESILNFKEINFQHGPQNICELCYINTSSTIKFHEMCDKSASYLKSYIQYQEEIKNMSEDEIMKTETCEERLISSEEVLGTEQQILNDELEKPNIDTCFEIITITTSNLVNSNDKPAIPEKDEIQVTANGVVKVKCKICNGFYRKRYMTLHKRVHTGERPYRCDICGKRFKDPNTIRLHKISHKDHPEYLCTICGKSFKWPTNLKTHLRLHSTERPHECEICGKTYKATEMLKQHYSVHSDERPFTCEICGKCFTLKKYLRQHMISHREVKRHECDFCGKRFTQSHSLRTHKFKYCKGTT